MKNLKIVFAGRSDSFDCGSGSGENARNMPSCWFRIDPFNVSH